VTRVIAIPCELCGRKFAGDETMKRHRYLAGTQVRCRPDSYLLSKNFYRDGWGCWHRGASLRNRRTALSVTTGRRTEPEVPIKVLEKRRVQPVETLAEPPGPVKSWQVKVYAGGDGNGRRRYPPLTLRTKILEKQGERCFYCDRLLGSIAYRKGQAVTLRTQWDHFAPFAYTQRSPHDGWVAACHVCNGIKGALVFQTIPSAVAFVKARRFEKGYRP
jgi:hypothetical protein